MKSWHKISFILVLIGAVNWGLVGLGGFFGGNWNVVNLLLGSWPTVEWIVYILVGVAGVCLAIHHKKSCKECSTGGSTM